VHIVSRHSTVFGLIAGLVLHTATQPTVKVGAKRLVVFLTPERVADGRVVLTTRAGRTLATRSTVLPVGTTKVVLPLPARARPGLYLVRVTARSGPAEASDVVRVKLVARS
jgi:hypothetical protein